MGGEPASFLHRGLRRHYQVLSQCLVNEFVDGNFGADMGRVGQTVEDRRKKIAQWAADGLISLHLDSQEFSLPVPIAGANRLKPVRLAHSSGFIALGAHLFKDDQSVGLPLALPESGEPRSDSFTEIVAGKEPASCLVHSQDIVTAWAMQEGLADQMVLGYMEIPDIARFLAILGEPQISLQTLSKIQSVAVVSALAAASLDIAKTAEQGLPQS